MDRTTATGWPESSSTTGPISVRFTVSAKRALASLSEIVVIGHYSLMTLAHVDAAGKLGRRANSAGSSSRGASQCGSPCRRGLQLCGDERLELGLLVNRQGSPLITQGTPTRHQRIESLLLSRREEAVRTQALHDTDGGLGRYWRSELAGRQGFEPRFCGSEPHVLPLNDLPAGQGPEST